MFAGRRPYWKATMNTPPLSRPPLPAGARRTDVAIAIGLVVGILLSSVLYRVAGFFPAPAEGWVTVPYALGIGLPLIWRRTHPLPAAMVVAAAFIVGGSLQVPEGLVSNISLFLAIYSIGAWEPRRLAAHLVRAAITVAMAVWLTVTIYLAAIDSVDADETHIGGFSPFAAFAVIQVITNLLYFGGAYYYGDRAWASAQARLELERRTAELERERERVSEQAVALDRVRIARELHDSVAHHVSVIAIQAGAARTSMSTNAAVARDALLKVEETARTAIDELHGLLGTLRDPDDDAEPGSTLGVSGLPSLIQASRDAGVPTDFDLVGAAVPLAPTLSLSLYRIAQEALTNVRKHAGADARASVRLRYLPGAVELEVANTGAVRSLRSPGGLGQLGMRERTAASGGTLEVGPRTRGGYLVRARMPLGGAA